MTSSVPLVWRDAMALIDAAYVGSHARLYQTKVLTMSCTLLIFLSESGSLVSYLTGYCTLVPY